MPKNHRRKPLVSIIIVNYNCREMLITSIEKALAQRFTDPFEVIIFENGSSDGSAAAVRERFSSEIKREQVRLFEAMENLGFVGGNNEGYKHARGKYVVFLNNDTEVQDDWLEQLIDPLIKYKQVGVVGSFEPVRNKRIADRFLKQRKMNASTLCAETVAVDRQSIFEEHLLQAFFVSGNGMAVRRAEFDKPFDDNYFAYAEDVYICWLARLRGQEVVMNLNARMFHHGASTKKQGGMISKIAIFNGTKNQIMNYLIFYEWKNILRVAPLFAITQLGHIVQNPRKIIVKLKAYFWILTNLGRIMRKRSKAQARRKLKDRELIRLMSCKSFDQELTAGRFQSAIVTMADALFRAYCTIAFLRTREFGEGAIEKQADAKQHTRRA